MPSQLDLEALRREVESLRESHQGTWEVSQGVTGLRAYVTLLPLGTCDRYCLRLDFGESLAAGPPSVTFCNPDTLVEGNARDWPGNLTQYFKHPPGNGVGWICNEWTREGRQHHAEWIRPWNGTRAVWRVATAIQEILDKPGNYTGRNP